MSHQYNNLNEIWSDLVLAEPRLQVDGRVELFPTEMFADQGSSQVGDATSTSSDYDVETTAIAIASSDYCDATTVIPIPAPEMTMESVDRNVDDYCKALYFRDDKTQKAIKEANTPDEQKRLGRKVKNFSESQWCAVREDVMLKGVIAKFQQNQNERAQLLNTKDMIIAEASPYDDIWGIGMSLTDPKAFNRSQWKGLNLLGTIIMKTRSFLQNEFEN